MKVMHVVLGVLLAGAVAGAVWKSQQPVAVAVAEDEGRAPARPVREAAASAVVDNNGPAPAWKAAEPVAELKGHEKRVTAAAFSPDGKRLASASADGTVRVWSVPEGKQLLRMDVPGGKVLSVGWSADGKRLVSGGWDMAVSVWDAASGALVDRHKQKCPAVAVRFVSDSTMVSACGDTVRWWKMGQEEQVVGVQLDEDVMITALDVTPAGEVVAANTGGLVVVLDGETGAEVERKMRPRKEAAGDAKLAKNWATGLKVQKDGGVMMADLSGVWLWDRKAGAVKLLVDRAGAWEAGLSPDGQAVVLATGSTSVVVDTVTGQEMLVKETPGGTANAIAISPGGEWYAVGSGGVAETSGAWREGVPPGLEVFSLPAAEGVFGRVRIMSTEVEERRKKLEPWR